MPTRLQSPPTRAVARPRVLEIGFRARNLRGGGSGEARSRLKGVSACCFRSDREGGLFTAIGQILGTATLGRMDALEYRRPPVTVSFEDLRRRGLPQVLFVHPFLPEGVTVCDVSGFAEMIEEAYCNPSTLSMRMELDEDGNERCRGIGNNGRWEWMVTRPTKLRNGQRYTSILQNISEILIAPELNGHRLCTVDLVPNGKEHLIDNPTPIVFAIRSGR